MAPQGPAYGGLGPHYSAFHGWSSRSQRLSSPCAHTRKSSWCLAVVPRPSSGLSALGSAVRPSEVPGALTDPSQVVALFNGISLTVAAAFGMGNHEQYLSNQDFSKAIH